VLEMEVEVAAAEADAAEEMRAVETLVAAAEAMLAGATLVAVPSEEARTATVMAVRLGVAAEEAMEGSAELEVTPEVLLAAEAVRRAALVELGEEDSGTRAIHLGKYTDAVLSMSCRTNHPSLPEAACSPHLQVGLNRWALASVRTKVCMYRAQSNWSRSICRRPPVQCRSDLSKRHVHLLGA